MKSASGLAGYGAVVAVALILILFLSFAHFLLRRADWARKRPFVDALLQASKAGTFDQATKNGLLFQIRQLRITDADVRRVRVSAFTQAFEAAKRDGVVTDTERAVLAEIRAFLKIPEEEIGPQLLELARIAHITSIRDGTARVDAAGILLHKGERAIWAEPASLIEECTVSRQWQGQSQGFSFRIAKGLTYRVGGTRGHSVAVKANVPTSDGTLLVTDQRIIFSGDAKSFSVTLEKMLNFHLFSDGLSLGVDGGKPNRVIKLKQPNGDLVRVAIDTALNKTAG